jgi:hypothetical protein
MKTELEEAAEKHIEKNSLYFDTTNEKNHSKVAFIEGAKWQQEKSYSEEEAGELVYNVIGQYARHYGIMIDGAKLNELFKEFKKK